MHIPENLTRCRSRASLDPAYSRIEDRGAHAGGTIECTARHPFRVIRGEDLTARPLTAELGDDNNTGFVAGRWVEAQYLRTGDVLLSQHRGAVPVEELAIARKTATVYNFPVPNCRTSAA